MFRRHKGRKSASPVFMLFRLLLSLVMFVVLLGGIYSAYKHFSGLDPLKLDPQAVVSNLLQGKIPPQLLTLLSSAKISPNILGKQVGNKIIPADSLNNFSNKTPSSALVFKFMLLTDSHNDNVDLRKAINQAKAAHPDLKFIIGLGDYTDVGTINELKAAKKELDSSTLRYFVIPGDHDLWECRNQSLPPTSCFIEVFGPAYQAFAFENFRFILINNSDNYEGLGDEQMKWVSSELQKAQTEGKSIFVFIHEPLFHPSSDHFMGRVEQSLKAQAKILVHEFKDAGVKRVFAGDVHYFSEYEEPESKLSMVTIGAITTDRNPQAPRFGIVSVFEDGSTKVEDVEIK